VLAYLFWHRPDPEADVRDYERRLSEFHDRLRLDRPLGFVASATFRTDAPWFGDGYEDWYLVDDWTSLGVLNAAAVDPSHQVEHDAVAALAIAGAGGVYELREGELPFDEVGTADWFEKPRGLAYDQMEADLIGEREADTYLIWRRQLVLGPAPEYCLLTRGDTLPRVV
jgi:hypothetical protein